MYEENKSNYKKIMNLTIIESKELKNKFPDIYVYQIIYNQLKSIKERVIDNQEIITRDEVFNKYSFGSIAAKNFDDSSFGNNLMFIYGLSYKYANLPDN